MTNRDNQQPDSVEQQIADRAHETAVRRRQSRSRKAEREFATTAGITTRGTATRASSATTAGFTARQTLVVMAAIMAAIIGLAVPVPEGASLAVTAVSLTVIVGVVLWVIVGYIAAIRVERRAVTSATSERSGGVGE